MELILKDITQPYYDEAQTASELFSDYDALPLKPYRDMINLLFKSCRYELKLALRLQKKIVRTNYRTILKGLKRGDNAVTEPKEEVAETAETLPSVMPDSALSSSQTASR